MIARMLQESVAFAFSQLRGDKFRTFLSLLGVSIGIFSIVAVFTAVDALEENVREGFEAFGSDIVMISLLTGITPILFSCLFSIKTSLNPVILPASSSPLS